MDLAGLFARRSRSFAVGVALAFLVAMGLADWLTGRDVSLSVFYVAPIALTTWFVSRRTGLLFAALSTLTWFLADDLGRPHAQPLVPYWNAAVRLGFYAVTVMILARLSAALEHERGLSRKDGTTGVANARAFLESASMEVERSRRFHRPTTLLYVDCDDFKAVNDNHGHLIGDEVLREAAQTMQDSVREVDLVARMGGDEFVILLTETDAAGADVAARRLHESLRQAMVRKGWSVTFSVGVATFPSGMDSLEAALREADELMYSAKRGGKDCATFAVFSGAT